MNTPPVLTAVCSVTLCSLTLWPCLGCSDQGADAVTAVDPTDEPHPVRGVPARPDIPEPLPIFETPESCWAALIKAKETNNPVAHLQCLATELLKSVHPEGTWGTDGVVPTLSNVTVQETYASGTLEVEGLEEPVPVVFILENGSWRFSSKSPPDIDGPDAGTH